MDSIELLMAIELPAQSDSEASSSTPSTTTSENEDETDTDNVNNEDLQLEIASDDDVDDDDEVIYTDEVINSTTTSSRIEAVLPAAPPTANPLPISLAYTTPPPPPPPSAKTPRFVPATVTTTTAAAAEAKGPPTPVIVTATPPLALVGPARPQSEYEPAASVAAARFAAQYTDSLRRRTETLIQKRLRTQRESIQKAKEIRQLTTNLSDLNSRLADELDEQKRLIDAYDRIRETAQRALGVLHVVRDAESVLADTKDRLLVALADRDDRHTDHHEQQPASRNDDRRHISQMSAAVLHDPDPLGLD